MQDIALVGNQQGLRANSAGAIKLKGNKQRQQGVVMYYTQIC